ncbi:MAG TPA: DUF305 domain-containing protein [Stenomitos sp.]
MNKELMIYSLAGFLAGSTVTALLGIATSKPSLQAIPTANLIAKAEAAPTQSVRLTQTTPPAQTTPVPFRGGMMGQPDQHFIVMMIPHHEGAVAMADLALSRAKHPEIKKLAAAIKTTQTQEIQEMRTWYRQWYGTDVPTWQPGMGMGMGRNRNNRFVQPQANNTRPVRGLGMGMGRMGCRGMGGMGTDLSALENATDFDREFIEQMIPHHQMAVMMATRLLSPSQRPELRNLAQSMITSQTAEIEQMEQWYQSWYP